MLYVWIVALNIAGSDAFELIISCRHFFRKIRFELLVLC